MTFDQYTTIKDNFFTEIKTRPHNELGFVDIKQFGVSRLFIFLLSYDELSIKFNSLVSSLTTSKYIVKGYRTVSTINILESNSQSRFEKYPFLFEQVKDYFEKHFAL